MVQKCGRGGGLFALLLIFFCLIVLPTPLPPGIRIRSANSGRKLDRGGQLAAGRAYLPFLAQAVTTRLLEVRYMSMRRVSTLRTCSSSLVMRSFYLVEESLPSYLGAPVFYNSFVVNSDKSFLKVDKNSSCKLIFFTVIDGV